MGSFDHIREDLRSRFHEARRILSFSDYLNVLEEAPRRHLRDSARYLSDAIAYFGVEERVTWKGRERHYGIFDAGSFRGGLPSRTRNDQLFGHEEAVEAVVRAIDSFLREGRVNRLILLHGPNGSAKSTLVACLMRGLELYSEAEEGALYRFSWIFPREGSGKEIGFGGGGFRDSSESFAYLPNERVQARIVPPVRDHPLLLIPRAERLRYLERLGPLESFPALLVEGELCHQNQQIFEALESAYQGDLRRVLAHIRVEREYLSRRYRRGLVTIGPEMSVDAHERQITADQSLMKLPAALSSLNLIEAGGDLVDGRAGLIEYSDLLKRPLEAFRYLLTAIENGEVSLRNTQLGIDSVLIASSNEIHLDAFKGHPEYLSFEGRLILVDMPYLLDVAAESKIYEAQIVPQLGLPIAPHTVFVLSLFAVMSRLYRPVRGNYEDERLGGIAASLSPAEKALLISYGEIPQRLDPLDAAILRKNARAILDEHRLGPAREGFDGISPRTIRSILLSLASRAEAIITPLDALEGLAQFIDERGDGLFRLNPDGGYYAPREFLRLAKRAWLDRGEAELSSASGLFIEGDSERLFERYIRHISHADRGERVINPITSADEAPSESFMSSIEARITEIGGPEFRKEQIARIADHALRSENGELDLKAIFPDLIQRLEASYFAEYRKELRALLESARAALSDHERAEDARGEGGGKAIGHRPHKEQAAPQTQQKPEEPREPSDADAAALIDAMRERYSYEPRALLVLIETILRERYALIG